MSDPLKQQTDGQRVLFENFAKVAHGFGTDQVIGASVNMLVNGIRQAHGRRDAGMARVEQLLTMAKTILASNYTNSGDRRNVFPFDQVIAPDLADFRKDRKFHKS